MSSYPVFAAAVWRVDAYASPRRSRRPMLKISRELSPSNDSATSSYPHRPDGVKSARGRMTSLGSVPCNPTTSNLAPSLPAPCPVSDPGPSVQMLNAQLLCKHGSVVSCHQMLPVGEEKLGHATLNVKTLPRGGWPGLPAGI